MDSFPLIPEDLCEEFALRQTAERLLLELDTSDFPVLSAGTGGGSSFYPDPTIKKAWRYLHVEVHSLICTKSSKYADERRAFTVLTKPLILVFGGLLTHEFGLAAATASSIAALALAMPLKLGRNAWCQAYKEALEHRAQARPEEHEYLAGERDQLIQLAQFQAKLTHKDAKERTRAIRNIKRYNVDPEIAVPLLVRALRDENEDVRGAAAYTLSDLGHSSRPAIPALIEALCDEDVWVRRHAASSFGHFPKDVSDFLHVLTEALKDPDNRVREEAAGSLGQLGVAARPALEALKYALTATDPQGQMREDALSRTRLFNKIFYAIRNIEHSTSDG